MSRKLMKLLLLLSAMTMLAASVNAHPWPVWPDSTYHQVSGLYGVWTGPEDQSYPPYMHSGADIDVPFPTPVYAIQPGYVKAVLTTQAGNPTYAPYYWRILIGDSSGTQPCDAWMYAHIYQYSIAVTVGQWVEVGDSLGVVTDWNDARIIVHLHLSKINFYGDAAHWASHYNDWEFIGNPLDEIDNVNDTFPPVLETAYNSQLLAFCANETSNYFEEGAALSGDVDIICRAYDYHNWYIWKAIPYSLEYSISGDSSIPWTNSVRFSQAFGTYDDMPSFVSVIFKDDGICNTYFDGFDRQDFYFTLTNTDGDTITETSDSQAAWQTANFHNGQYLVRVKASDRSWNSAIDSMTVTVANYFTLSGHVGLGDGNPYPAGTIVTAVPGGKSDTTDTAGNYSIPLVDGGSQMITFSRPGYETIDTVVMMNQEHQIDVVLTLGVFLCGDGNNDNIVNIRDVTFLINFLYKSGPPPLVYQAADVNSDTIVNIRDVTYLINNLYKSGPNPECPF
ncbi:MAG: dockerin type I domain-containing protein [candidate division Zixibacteria bacterium]|nr:dockerin type I domain-containing protein [candidate division Zixibacteria bacterium]